MDAYNCCHTCAEEARCKMFGLRPDLVDELGACACSHWSSKGLTPDNVNHPSHYETGKFECFDVWKDGEPMCKIKRTDFGLSWPVERRG